MTRNLLELFLRQSAKSPVLTRLLLHGSVSAVPAAVELEQLLALLARWSGAPVELVLSVDAGSVAWFESWGDATATVPARHLQVRFTTEGHHRRGEPGVAR